MELDNMDLEERPLYVLNIYEKMCQDTKKQVLIVKDKVLLHFLLHCLQSKQIEVVEKALLILETLEKNRCTHHVLRSAFVANALLFTGRSDEISDELKTDSIRRRASQIYTNIKNTVFLSCPGPSGEFDIDSATRKMTFYVKGLTEDRKALLINTILKVNGVVSVVVDFPHLRCVVMGTPACCPAHITVRIAIETPMTATQIVKNRYGQEVLERGLKHSCECHSRERNCDEPLPEYLPDCESPPSGRGLLSFNLFRSQASQWLKSTSDFLQEAFYW